MIFGANRSANSAMKSSRLFASSAVPGDAEALIEEERAEFGVAGVVVREKQRRRRGIDGQRARRVHERPDVIVVPGFPQAHRSFDGGNADNAVVGPLDQHEGVTRIGALGGACERRERSLDPLGEAITICGKRRQARAGALGQREYRRKIVARDRANEKHRYGAGRSREVRTPRPSPGRHAHPVPPNAAGVTPARD